jgi:type IV pilus assembly protein PilB
MATKLGQLLLNNHIITEEQLEQALDLQNKEGGRLGSNLIKLGYLTEEKLVAFLSQQFGVPAINLSEYEIDTSLTKFVPVDVAQKYLILPVARVGATLTVAMVDCYRIFYKSGDF